MNADQNPSKTLIVIVVVGCRYERVNQLENPHDEAKGNGEFQLKGLFPRWVLKSGHLAASNVTLMCDQQHADEEAPRSPHHFFNS